MRRCIYLTFLPPPLLSLSLSLSQLSCCVPPLDSEGHFVVEESNAESSLAHFSAFRGICASAYGEICDGASTMTVMALYNQRHVLRNPAFALSAEPTVFVELVQEALTTGSSEEFDTATTAVPFELFEQLLVRPPDTAFVKLPAPLLLTHSCSLVFAFRFPPTRRTCIGQRSWSTTPRWRGRTTRHQRCSRRLR